MDPENAEDNLQNRTVHADKVMLYARKVVVNADLAIVNPPPPVEDANEVTVVYADNAVVFANTARIITTEADNENLQEQVNADAVQPVRARNVTVHVDTVTVNITKTPPPA